MNLRLFAVAMLVFTLGAPVASFADVVDDFRSALSQQGYSQVEVIRTLLGRTRIVATNEQGVRELVINPRTGEVLRDVWTTHSGKTLPPVLSDLNSLASQENGGSGGSGYRDDDGDDDDDGGDDHHGGRDDDDDDDDSSGHGSGHDDDD